MKKTGILLLLLLVFVSAAALGGCAPSGEGTADGRRDVAFTAVDMRKIPEELAKLIEENKQEEIRMTYTDGGDTYLIRGYGEQATGGYSIKAVSCTEDEETVYFDTRLLGPSGQEKLPREASYPVLVVKIETREKEVLIQ